MQVTDNDGHVHSPEPLDLHKMFEQIGKDSSVEVFKGTEEGIDKRKEKARTSNMSHNDGWNRRQRRNVQFGCNRFS